MGWVFRTIIVPDAYVDIARAACEHLAGAGGSGMYTTPLSATGALPATHYVSSGLIEDTFADLLANPDALTAVASAGGYADETLSARAHRVAEEGGPAWPQRLINALFFWERQHCLKAYRSEVERYLNQKAKVY